jgi:hypothetical protein
MLFKSTLSYKVKAKFLTVQENFEKIRKEQGRVYRMIGAETTIKKAESDNSSSAFSVYFKITIPI